ncbi:MAG: efflux RND transporter periplasmic adaptor subunit [Dehalococcoidia bacterium]|nr:efflux RND transporter periplasmic adaptor subunit [Dehalococcoidia bacterium]
MGQLGWKLAGALVALAAACQTSAQAPATAANAQLVEARIGVLRTSINATGSVVLTAKQSLTFGSAGTVESVAVKWGQAVTKGQVLAKLNTQDLEFGVARAKTTLANAQDILEKARTTSAADLAKAEAAVTSAQAGLQSAQIVLDKAKAPYTAADLAKAEAAVRSAKVAVTAAQTNLDKALVPYTADDIAGQRAGILSLQAGLDNITRSLTLGLAGADLTAFNTQRQNLITALVAAQTQLQTMLKGPDAVAVEAQASALQTAQSALQRAQDELALVKKGADPLDVTAKAGASQSAQANLLKVQEDLATVKKGPDPLVLLLRQSDVDSAKKALSDAEANLAKATIVAPYDGVVSDVPVIAGQSVGASTVAVAVVDPSAVEVQAQVDEIDVAQIQAGQPASITLEALPSARLLGQVSAVATLGTIQQGVVSYRFTLTLRGQRQVTLREGMTAQAAIIVSSKENVLLIPVRAVRNQAGVRSVQVATEGKLDGKIEARQVQVGATNETQVEIVSGLKAGEHVVVAGGARSTQGAGGPPGGFSGGPGGPGGGLGIPGGGGFGGGGAPGGGGGGPGGGGGRGGP